MGDRMRRTLFLHPNSNRDASGETKRTTQNGFWKAAGKDKQILCLGNSPRGIRSSWMPRLCMNL